jgi:ZIP family zinc transporter
MLDQLFIPFLLSFLAGISTLVGGLIAFFIKKFKTSYLSLILGFSAGVMIFISFVEFLMISIKNIGFLYANIGFFLGIIAIYLLDLLIPHIYEEEKTVGDGRKLKKIGMLVALGIAIHNIPEGIAVSFSSISSIKLGILVAVAIALHNIPEGISVSAPIYYATKSKRKALWYSFLSGIVEPIGAILALLLLYPFINGFNLNFMFAVVAGIMVFISFDELLPTCFRYKKFHISILGLFIGMFLMSMSLYFFGIT